jgi:hypothetical protein
MTLRKSTPLVLLMFTIVCALPAATAGVAVIPPSAFAQQEGVDELSPEEIQNEILRGNLKIERTDNDITTTESSLLSLMDGNLLAYESPFYGIRTQYPEGWEILIQSTSNSSISLRFDSPPENDTDIFRENILFVIDTVSNNTTLSNFTSAAVTTYLEKYPDLKFNEVSSTNLTNNTIPAYKLVASRTQDGLEFMQIFAIEEGKLYTILYSSEKTRYSTYLPIIEKVIDSFEAT